MAGEGGIFGGSQLGTDFKCGISRGWGGAIRGLLGFGVSGWFRLVRESGGYGLTQEALAERMGTTQSAIARLEGGRVSPSVETLRKYAKAVGKRLKVEMV